MLCVDRASFIAWTEGVLLSRDAAGRCVVGDNADHEKVEDILEAGGEVGLTVRGKLVSILKLVDDEYQEQRATS